MIQTKMIVETTVTDESVRLMRQHITAGGMRNRSAAHAITSRMRRYSLA